MVLLLGAIQNTRAIIYFDGENYAIETEKYILGEGEVLEDIIYTDLSGDGNSEKIILKNGTVMITGESGEIFRTDPGWHAVEILVGDFNNNGVKDLGIYLWKTGNYGPSMPFWVKENDDSFKQHLFLYTWGDDALKSLWHSSNLPYENVKTILADVSKDGKNELVVLERPYGLEADYGLTVAVWRWDEWGFTNIWRSDEGKFHDIKIR